MLGKKREDLDKKRKDLGKKREDLGKKREDLGKKREDLDKKREDLGKKREDLDKKREDLGKRSLRMSKIPQNNRRMYDTFIEGAPYDAPAKQKPHDKRSYVDITCPHCLKVFVEIPKELVPSNKASRCKAHLALCPSYTPPAPKEADLATELRKAREAHAVEREADRLRYEVDQMRYEAQKEEAQRRHEELMAQLRDANGQLSSVEGQLRDANGQLTSVEGKLSTVEGQLTDVEGQLRFKRQCLTDVREWGHLREPDNTLVPQLTCREQAVAAAHQTEVSRMRAELEVLRAAAKEKAPAAVVARALEADTRMARADAKMASADAEAEAKVAKMQNDWDAFRAAKFLEVGNANANASRADSRTESLKRKIQLLVHPDKVPEEARKWATHVFQTVFPERT